MYDVAERLTISLFFSAHLEPILNGPMPTHPDFFWYLIPSRVRSVVLTLFHCQSSLVVRKPWSGGSVIETLGVGVGVAVAVGDGVGVVVAVGVGVRVGVGLAVAVGVFVEVGV